jgi:hypothetical protein
VKEVTRQHDGEAASPKRETLGAGREKAGRGVPSRAQSPGGLVHAHDEPIGGHEGTERGRVPRAEVEQGPGRKERRIGGTNPGPAHLHSLGQ